MRFTLSDEPKAPKSTLRTPPEKRRAAAAHFAKGWSIAAVARALHLDWQTAQRIKNDPETKDRVASRKQSKPGGPQTEPKSTPNPADSYKIPLDEVPQRARWIMREEIRSGRVQRDCLTERVRAAIDEYNPDVPLEPLPKSASVEPSKSLQRFVDMMNGPYGGGRVVCFANIAYGQK
jgi:hypothetical protein